LGIGHGALGIAHGAWRIGHGALGIAHGASRMGHGAWGMGQWAMGHWKPHTGVRMGGQSFKFRYIRKNGFYKIRLKTGFVYMLSSLSNIKSGGILIAKLL
jgi:hypothetical protein